jgi:nucleoside phosphorylase
MRRVGLFVATAFLLGGVGVSPLQATTVFFCPEGPRLLIESAFPTELGGIMKATVLDDVQPDRSPAPKSKEFWVGTLMGKPVIETLTGIGPVNAHDTTQAAFDLYGADCITGIVFSGVAGAGPGTRIGDVTVPDRWSQDGGNTWVDADPALMAVAETLHPTLTATNNLGDPACVCPQEVQDIPVATFDYQPVVIFHGDGATSDPFGGKAAPCLQGGGDLAGCEPCPAALGTSPDPMRFATGMADFVGPDLVLGLIGLAGTPSHHVFIEGDEETGAAAEVARDHGVPFIGFRSISDGTPDPLHLENAPFPTQFLVYKQISADNAAAMTLAFVAAWS